MFLQFLILFANVQIDISLFLLHIFGDVIVPIPPPSHRNVLLPTIPLSPTTDSPLEPCFGACLLAFPTDSLALLHLHGACCWFIHVK